VWLGAWSNENVVVVVVVVVVVYYSGLVTNHPTFLLFALVLFRGILFSVPLKKTQTRSRSVEKFVITVIWWYMYTLFQFYFL